ncbi:MAG: hypothetical protein ACRCV9_17260 [Burkholderiaceae bacterium]
MNFVFVLSIIVLAGIAGAAWVMRRRELALAAQLREAALFDAMFLAPQRVSPPAKLRAVTPEPAAQPASAHANPLRELALVMYESRGYQRLPATTHVLLQRPGKPDERYAMLELDVDCPADAKRIDSAVKRLGAKQVRVLVLCKQGFTSDAKALAKQSEIKLLDNKVLKRKLAQLPDAQRAQLLQRVKHNLAHAQPPTLH